MKAYAIVETGGKQYMVHKDDVVAVEKLDAEAGTQVELDKVLAVSNGTELVVGTPLIDKASITATVVEQTRGKKVVSFKKKRRKGYSRKVGHRQRYTKLKIHEFVTGEAASKPAKKEEAPAEEA